MTRRCNDLALLLCERFHLNNFHLVFRTKYKMSGAKQRTVSTEFVRKQTIYNIIRIRFYCNCKLFSQQHLRSNLNSKSRTCKTNNHNVKENLFVSRIGYNLTTMLTDTVSPPLIFIAKRLELRNGSK